MKHTAYHRGVVNALRRDYGVSARIETGGNHPALVFHYHGQPQRVTLHNQGDESNILALKLQDLRRLLGPPLRMNGRKPKRTMEDLMEQLVHEAREAGHSNAPSPAPDYTRDVHAMGAMAGYRDRGHDVPRLRFFLPEEVSWAFMERLGLTAPARVLVQRRAPNDWEVSFDQSPTSKGPALRFVDGRFAIDAGRSTSEGLEPFGTTPAEYALIGTTIMVVLKADQLRPVQLGNKQVVKRKTVTKTAEAPPVPELVPATRPKSQALGTPTDDDMQRALFTIRQVEERTPFRLTKIKDDRGQRWCFQARIE